MNRVAALPRNQQLMIFAGGILLSLAIWFLEINTVRQISYAIFYLIPIYFVSWYTTRTLGIITSAAAALMWMTSDLVMFPEHHLDITLWNTAMRFGFDAVVAILLSALHDAYRREQAYARIDPSTEAPNARHFYEMTDHEVSRSKRYGHPISAVYLDVDNFKAVNDRFGHATGDELLVKVVETIQEHIRDSDVVARLGGDEFAILLPETGRKPADAVIQKVHQNLLAEMKRKDWPVSFSVGAVTYLHAPDSAEEIIEKADELMYSVKHSGKDRIRHVTLDRPVFSEKHAASARPHRR